MLAGQLFGIPVRGTHAHSWVQAFGDEQVAFDAYADVHPTNVVFLVDTYDTLTGVRERIETGRRLRERGHDLAGIRLDSGDLAYLSIEARRMLDAAGFEATRIVASNDLDEGTIGSLKGQGARIDTWGVGTRLVTCYDQPALGGGLQADAPSATRTGRGGTRSRRPSSSRRCPSRASSASVATAGRTACSAPMGSTTSRWASTPATPSSARGTCSSAGRSTAATRSRSCSSPCSGTAIG